jgi:hypothetical protein
MIHSLPASIPVTKPDMRGTGAALYEPDIIRMDLWHSRARGQV